MRNLIPCLVLVATLFDPWVARALTISEVLYDAVGSDDGQLFVELYGAPGTVLDGYKLEGVNGADGALGPILVLSGAIPSDGFFVVADPAGGMSTVAGVDLLLEFDLQNGPDSIRLRTPDGTLLDALGYGVFSAGELFAGEGMSAPDPPAGQSLARLFANVDTDDNSADFGPLAAPTPGTGPLSVPEPRPHWLLLTLTCALVAARRANSRTPRTSC